ncbi:MAG TPA: NAD-dependent epimerase/dehydratase family protein [Sandaracinaceae bacterium LLY-WYZ-13_1]|nr:NAD-dependent epimerase/dehydratase family protein [Sandaracinaceae bacterium LLY-WYZ-13_1]
MEHDGTIERALPGRPPPAPPWGQRLCYDAPALEARLAPDEACREEVAVVLGAGGAFGPDVVRGLVRRGLGLVVGADVQLSYPVPGVVYRRVDLADPRALDRFLGDVWALARERGLRPGPVFDLSTIQTSPRRDADRDALEHGKASLVDVLCRGEGDRRLFFMSTAEIYGAPPGAPYREDRTPAPFNAYGRAKQREERDVLDGHDRRTRRGRLRVVALRSWTIAMVETAPDGAVVEARNYNDPIVFVAQALARAGVRVPVTDPSLLGTFHLGEEVAEVAVKLGCAPPDAPTWGRAFNQTGRPASHGAIRDVLYDVFADAGDARPPWGPLAARALAGGRLPERAIERLARALERTGGLLGARDVAGRLPFLYRSTHLDTTALTEALGDALREPGDTREAVRRLATGLLEGGPHALNQRRYRSY